MEHHIFELETRNSKPGTRNSKLETRNPLLEADFSTRDHNRRAANSYFLNRAGVAFHVDSGFGWDGA